MKLPELDPLAKGVLITLLSVVIALFLAFFVISKTRNLLSDTGIEEPVWTLIIVGAGVCVSLLLRVTTKHMSTVIAPADVDITPDLFSQSVVLNLGSMTVGAYGDPGGQQLIGLLFLGIIVSALVYIYLAQRHLRDGNLKQFLGGTMSLIPLCFVSHAFVGLVQ